MKFFFFCIQVWRFHFFRLLETIKNGWNLYQTSKFSSPQISNWIPHKKLEAVKVKHVAIEFLRVISQPPGGVKSWNWACDVTLWMLTNHKSLGSIWVKLFPVTKERIWEPTRKKLPFWLRHKKGHLTLNRPTHRPPPPIKKTSSALKVRTSTKLPQRHLCISRWVCWGQARCLRWPPPTFLCPPPRPQRPAAWEPSPQTGSWPSWPSTWKLILVSKIQIYPEVTTPSHYIFKIRKGSISWSKRQ